MIRGTSSVDEPLEPGALEAHAHRRREARAVRPALPAQVVQREGLLEGAPELGQLARDGDGQLALLAELPAPAAVEVALLRVRLVAVDGVPAAR